MQDELLEILLEDLNAITKSDFAGFTLRDIIAVCHHPIFLLICDACRATAPRGEHSGPFHPEGQ